MCELFVCVCVCTHVEQDHVLDQQLHTSPHRYIYRHITPLKLLHNRTTMQGPCEWPQITPPHFLLLFSDLPEFCCCYYYRWRKACVVSNNDLAVQMIPAPRLAGEWQTSILFFQSLFQHVVVLLKIGLMAVTWTSHVFSSKEELIRFF